MQFREENVAVNLCHTLVQIPDETALRLVQLLDGTRDRPALARELEITEERPGAALARRLPGWRCCSNEGRCENVKMRTRIALAALSAFLCATALADTKMVVLLIGPPGAGKTTQARKISRKYRIPSISMSDLLQKDAGWGKAGSKKVLQAQMESGELVNDETADLLVRKRLFLKDAERGFILDGYPANAAQADNLGKLLQERNLPPAGSDLPGCSGRGRARADEEAPSGGRYAGDDRSPPGGIPSQCELSAGAISGSAVEKDRRLAE